MPFQRTHWVIDMLRVRILYPIKSRYSRSVQWQSDMLSQLDVRLFSSPGLPPLKCVLFWKQRGNWLSVARLTSAVGSLKTGTRDVPPK